jgi:hypothetical protein
MKAHIQSGSERASLRAIHTALLNLQEALERTQRLLDQGDIAIEVALEDPGVFLRSPQAVKNLDRSLRDLTGVCDSIMGHLGMIHHTVKGIGSPSEWNVRQAQERVAQRWLSNRESRHAT